MSESNTTLDAIVAIEKKVTEFVSAKDFHFNNIKSMAETIGFCAKARASLATSDERNAQAMAHKIATTELVDVVKTLAPAMLEALTRPKATKTTKETADTCAEPGETLRDYAVRTSGLGCDLPAGSPAEVDLNRIWTGASWALAPEAPSTAPTHTSDDEPEASPSAS